MTDRARASRAVAALLALTLGACAGGAPPKTPLAPPAGTPTPSAETPLAPDSGAPGSDTDWSVLALARLPGLEPCSRKNVHETLLCGTIEVWENRAAASGRKIGLAVVVVPAKSATPPADPVFVFEGGPGGAATGRAAGSVWAGRVRERDIVLVDQRGTGDSNRLDCDLTEATAPGELRRMFPPERVRACAAELGKRADLTLYTSAEHADDIEEVRRRLGYGPINIRGGSYGTHAMMVFAQRHPTSTRTLFGIGATPPLRSSLAERGISAERALAGLDELCAANEPCSAVVPSLAAAVAELLAALDDAPRRVTIRDPSNPGERLTLTVTRPWLSEVLRLNLYFAFTSRALPWAVHRAATAGDYAPLAELGVILERMFQSELADGVLLAVQCSELMGFDVEAALARGADTLFGNYRLEQQLQGCAEWPHEARPPLGVEGPKVLDVPALYLSGALDAVTPPVYAEEAMTLLLRSRHVVLTEGQHGPFDLEGSWGCVHDMWADLLDTADPEAIDVSCADAMRRPPFIVDKPTYRAYVAETLAPLAGQ